MESQVQQLAKDIIALMERSELDEIECTSAMVMVQICTEMAVPGAAHAFDEGLKWARQNKNDIWKQN